jgi:hypothetical protein
MGADMLVECFWEEIDEKRLAIREITSLEFPPFRIFITGGISYGDSPSGLFNDLGMLTQLEVLEATGLNPSLPDTMAIVKKLSRSEELQPLLVNSKNLSETRNKNVYKFNIRRNYNA